MPYAEEVDNWPLLVFATLSSCWSGQVDCPKDVSALWHHLKHSSSQMASLISAGLKGGIEPLPLTKIHFSAKTQRPRASAC